ncbi:hypothetical protein PWM41_004119 [Providencia rettgeri]|uniref:hypothetical protein n=1 Tax=Providencia sp. PROV036 TaxID=2949767 RepID=UPI00234AD372|nr:hypothetical protein [Providencia sp. PROV036]EMB5788505.1 hypothetical protein [Providencia rettgeri]
MYWKIPTIPDKTLLTKPNYKIVVVFFTTLAAAIYMYGATLPTEQKTRLFLFSLPVVALLFFLSISSLYIRYQHAVITFDNWEKEKEITKQEWQAWCQSSISSIANVIYTPDKDGTDVFLKEAEAIPMFPDKPRRLFNNLQLDENFITAIDLQLEKQCPNYRFYLTTIYILDNNSDDSDVLIYNQWHLKPIKPSLYKDIFSIYENKINDTFLVITIQSASQFSEFISAQLFSNDDKLINSSRSRIEIERIIEFDNQDIDNDIVKYIDYSGISKKDKFQTWITDSKQDLVDNLLITYTEKNIEFDKTIPIRSLALSYSTPHPNAFLTYLSLVTEISLKTELDQVLIHPNPYGASYAVYIRRS